MADVYDINRITSATKNGVDFMYYTALNLIAQGATIQSYGTGTAGSYVASSAGWSYANFSTTTRSWFRLRMPSPSTEEWCFQTISPAETSGQTTTWTRARIKVSPIAFTGGSPAAAVMPSSTKERVLVGGAGTDASPTLTASTADLLTVSSGAVRMHTICQDASGNTNPWYTFAHNNGSTTVNGLMFSDVLIAGSFDALDVYPYVQYAAPTVGGTQYFYMGYGTGSEAAVTMTQPSSQLVFDGARPVDPASGKDAPGRMLYYAASQPAKGYGKGVSCKGQARAYPNTFNLATANAKVYLGAASAGLCIKWPTAQTALL